MKKVLITGVAQGFGSYLVKRFSSEGYSVGGVDKVPFEDLSAEVNGLLVNYWQIDLSNIQGVSSLAKAMFEEFKPDVLINNAAIKFFKRFEDVSIIDVSNVSNVNFVSPIILTKIWLEVVNQNNLICIFMSSNAAYYGYASGTLYCSTKSGLRSFAQALTEEYSDKQLKVITLCPESFRGMDVEPSKSDVIFSMEDIYIQTIKAIKSSKSSEIAILKPKTKLRYCFYEGKKFLKWFMGKM
jgi:short-subunit dehydrogenase